MAKMFPVETLSDDLSALLCVRRGDASYGGWRSDLLTDVLHKGEERFLLCKACQGLLRDACLLINEGKQEFRCSVCLPKNVTVQRAQINQESVNEKHVRNYIGTSYSSRVGLPI